MSYNPNDPNQQWQSPVKPNQQQLQPSNQQATSNPSNPGGGNYQQNQQSYSWTDGNTQGQHHSTQQSWSWQGQTTTPMIQSPPALPALPILNQGTSHQQLHQQVHQDAMAHHQNVMNNMHQNMTSLMSNIPPMVQQTPLQPQITHQTVSPPPQIAWQQNVVHSPQQQAHIAYQPAQLMSPEVQVPQSAKSYQQVHVQQQPQHNPTPTSPIAMQPQLQYPQNTYQQTQSQQSPSFQVPTVQIPHPQALQQQPLAQQRPQITYIEQPPQSQQMVQQRPQQYDHGDRFQDPEEQRSKDLESMNRAGSEINKRLHELEQSKTRAQNDQQAKDREVRKLKEQLASVERQRRQDAERNSQQLAELVRSQETFPPAQTPAFDMSALQEVIRETQAQQLSPQDIKRVIEEQVGKHLSGMATEADIQNAGAQMQNALSQVPAGLNEAQVQQAVNRELNNVMQDVANRVNQQRRIAGQGNRAPQSGQIPQDRVQTEFVIEELPDEGPATQTRNVGTIPSTQRALPSTGHYNTSSTMAPTVGSNVSPVPTMVAGEVRQAPPQRPGATMQPPNRPQYAAIEASPMASVAPMGALALVDTSVPATTAGPGSSNALTLPATSAQQRNVAYVQPHLATAQPTPTHGWSMPPSGLVPQPTAPSMPQRQLEVAPRSTQDLGIARAQHAQLFNQGAAQIAAQPRQIEAASSQRQLEAPPSSPAGYPATSQELVHQSRDIARQGPGKEGKSGMGKA